MPPRAQGLAPRVVRVPGSPWTPSPNNPPRVSRGPALGGQVPRQHLNLKQNQNQPDEKPEEKPETTDRKTNRWKKQEKPEKIIEGQSHTDSQGPDLAHRASPMALRLASRSSASRACTHSAVTGRPSAVATPWRTHCQIWDLRPLGGVKGYTGCTGISGRQQRGPRGGHGRTHLRCAWNVLRAAP